MKTYKVPCSWTMYGYADVNANSIEEAFTIAQSYKTQLPNGHYVPDSFEVDKQMLEDEPMSN